MTSAPGPESQADGGAEGGRRRSPSRSVVATAAAVVLVVAGVALAAVGVVQHEHHDAALSAQSAHRAAVARKAAAETGHHHVAAPPATSQDHHRAPTPTTSPPVVPAAKPAVSTIDGSGATLVVPALSVRAPIVTVGAVEGAMSIPSDIHTVGWYDGIDTTGEGTAPATPSAPFPGQPGVALLAGHVDWAGEGPGALYYLSELEVGDPVEVVGSNGVTTHWRVSQPPVTIAKSALPQDLFSSSGPPQLALVTCGGAFDYTTGHYEDNVIVWTSPAAPS